MTPLARPHRKISLVCLAAALACVPACGKGLSGNYVKCIVINASTSKLATYSFPDATDFTYQSVSFTASTSCTGTSSTPLKSAGTYAEDVSTVPGAQNITLTFTSGDLKDTTLYQIFKLDSNTLYLGDTSGTNDGSTDAKRPTAFETTGYPKQ